MSYSEDSFLILDSSFREKISIIFPISRKGFVVHYNAINMGSAKVSSLSHLISSLII